MQERDIEKRNRVRKRERNIVRYLYLYMERKIGRERV